MIRSLTQYKEWAKSEATTEELRREFRALMRGEDPSRGQELTPNQTSPRLHMIAAAGEKLAARDIEAILDHPRFHHEFLPTLMSEADLSEATQKQLMKAAHERLQELAEHPPEPSGNQIPASLHQRTDRFIKVLSVGQEHGLDLEPAQKRYWVQDICQAPGGTGELCGPLPRMDNDRSKRLWSHVLSNTSLETDQLWRLFHAPVLVERNFRATFKGHPSADLAFWRKALTEADPPVKSASLLKGLARMDQLVRDPVCHRALREKVPPPSLTRMIQAVDRERNEQAPVELFRKTFLRLADLHLELAAGVLRSHARTARAVLTPSDLASLTASNQPYVQKAAWELLATMRKNRSPKEDPKRSL